MKHYKAIVHHFLLNKNGDLYDQWYEVLEQDSDSLKFLYSAALNIKRAYDSATENVTATFYCNDKCVGILV